VPIAKKPNGWYWGGKGPFATKAKAQAVARAAYANGYSKQGNTMKFSVEQSQNNPVGEFATCLLHSVTGAHMLHLATYSFAEHKALEAFYTGVGDLVDEFVEAYQGKYVNRVSYVAGFDLPTEPVDYLTYLKDEVATLRVMDGFPQDSELQNITDEIASLIDGTLYQLTLK
jgi:hypothetical protein